MSDYQFIQDTISKQWVIFSTKRSKRPDSAHEVIHVCPFCIGKEKDEEELYRVGGNPGDSNWMVRVLHNKFPFAPSHEIIIHSPDHHKTFGELPLDHVRTLLEVYRQRYRLHHKEGLVYIFYNHGTLAGQSQPHPHTQLVVIPPTVTAQIPRIGEGIYDSHNTTHFSIFAPLTSHWPDEVWIAPKRRNKTFGEITDEELENFAFALDRLIMVLDMRHGNEFPYNFYIYPGDDWYLRVIPRFKSLGGFEIGTHIYVNTQDPLETIAFIKEHFDSPDSERIKKEAPARYRRGV